METIPRTERAVWPGSTFAHGLDECGDILVTLWLRGREDGELDAVRARELCLAPLITRAYDAVETLKSGTGADAADVATLRTCCAKRGFTVVAEHWRSMVISGPIDRLAGAFGANVAVYTDAGGTEFRLRSGSLHAESEVAPLLRGVFGFQQWPKSRRLGALTRHATPLTASQVASRYAFPAADGTNQTVAIVQMGGQFKAGDFERCMQAQHIAPPQPIVKRVDNAAEHHEIDTGKDLEAALDSQIVAALAPGARIVIYQAPDDERGFLDAVRTAIFDEEYRPAILSISYGWPEFLWTPVALDILEDLFTAAALLGISVFCSSGDNGAELDYDGKPHVIAPASCPFVHACGATSIASGANGDVESAWEHTGGGFSERFDLPQWQNIAGDVGRQLQVTPRRGVPDVSVQESPGYCVYLDGVELAAGGTSAAAPAWAALTARINQRLQTRCGFYAPLLYAANEGLLGDIVTGCNDKFVAQRGWDACTGLGVPVGTAIESELRGAR